MMANRQSMKRAARHKATQEAIQAQALLNAVLWQIVMQHAQAQSEASEEPVESGALTVPLSELKDVPRNFQLLIQKSDNAYTIIAKTPANQNIILPGQN